MSAAPPIIPVGQELPAHSPSPAPSPRPQGKAKGTARGAGRFAMLNAFVDQTLAGLGRSELAVWLILFRDSRDGIACTGWASLAKRAKCNRSTVARAIASLVRRDLVEIVQRGGIGRSTSRYRLRALSVTSG